MRHVWIGVGLFALGLILGFEAAWVMGLTRPTQARISTPAPPPIEWVDLTLSASIDGTGRFIFSATNVVYQHQNWDPPRSVVLNGLPWPDLKQTPEGWVEFAAQLDLPHAVIVERRGRDVIALEPAEAGFALYCADSLLGAGRYYVRMQIPKK